MFENENDFFYTKNYTFSIFEEEKSITEENDYDLSFPKSEFLSNEISSEDISKKYETEKELKEENSIKDFSEIYKKCEIKKEIKEENSINNFYVNTEINFNEKKIKKNYVKEKEKDSNDNKEHNKYLSDSLIRKSKQIVMESLIEFINKKIKLAYKGKIGDGILKKELKKISQTCTKIVFSQNFILKTIGEIFSGNISEKYTDFTKNHNKIIINQLINENNLYIKNYFNKIFNLKFIDCLDHFIGKEHIDILNGLKCYEDKDIKGKIIKKYGDGENYSKNLEYYLNNYQDILNKKRGRNSKKSSNN